MPVVSLVLTAFDDTLSLLDATDDHIVDGLAGNDRISTGAGADIVFGNGGDDVIATGDGDDTITYRGTGGGYDAVDGGAGSGDRIAALANGTVIGLQAISGIETVTAGGYANVRIASGATGDFLDFSSSALIGIASIDAGAGNDTVIGSEGDDTIIGGAGNDTLIGGDGADRFLLAGGAGIDSIDGGDGLDAIRITATRVTLTWGSVFGIESIESGFSGFRILGTSAANLLDFYGIIYQIAAQCAPLPRGRRSTCPDSSARRRPHLSSRRPAPCR